MQRLWTPWRMVYLSGTNHMTDCILCAKGAEDNDDANYVVARRERAFLLLNLYPYTNGHMMVTPYAHVSSLEELDEATLLDMMILINLSTRLLRQIANPAGFNIGANIGRAAGAGIADHVHIHVVPRWEGDTNFMAILAETRMIPELLDQTYRRLRAALEHDGR